MIRRFVNRIMPVRQNMPMSRLPNLFTRVLGHTLIIAAASLLTTVSLKAAETADALRLVAMGKARLPRDTGVWITKTYSAAWSFPGFVEIHWYNPPGTPHLGYVRERDLYLRRKFEETSAITLSCVILDDGTFTDLGDCADIQPDGTYTVTSVSREQLKFDRHGLAVVVLRGEGYALVRRDGRALVVPTFDNGPDEFINGLVRVRIGEKLGYTDRKLKLVIPAVYDGAFRFERGRAWVCIGCVSVSDGEHSFYKGGTAICIDPRGSKRPDAECGNSGWLLPQFRE